MKFCTKCVIPETAESHSFDKSGSCSVCSQLEFKNKNIDWNSREQMFDNLLKNYRGKSDYDCILPFSGGKDSVFALWYVVKVKKLNPLVVRFDHNFLRDTVQKNTEKAIKKLNVDFLNIKPKFDVIKKVMIESLYRRGDFCWHCHTGITATPINIAIEKKIPLVIYGEPSAEYASFYSYDEFEEMNVDKFNKMVNLGINAEDMLGMVNERFPNDKITLEDLRPYVFPTKREMIKHKIKACYLGNYFPWDVKKQVKIIKDELEWEGTRVEGIPEMYDYEKIECAMQGVRDYLRYIKRGFGRTSHLTSIDIRNKRMTREEAVKLVQMYDGKRPKALEYFLKILGMNEDEFYKIALAHVVYPHKPEDISLLKSKKTNQHLNDLDDWYMKFSKLNR
tara:strand:- start:2120 stop:3295 length:1176 start_codon:yes stop_codon:yes gene_type:complete